VPPLRDAPDRSAVSDRQLGPDAHTDETVRAGNGDHPDSALPGRQDRSSAAISKRARWGGTWHREGTRSAPQ